MVVAFVDVPNVVETVHCHGLVRVMVPPRATDPPPVNPDPAVTVRAPELVRRELPIVEVETTLPVLSVLRSALVRLVR